MRVVSIGDNCLDAYVEQDRLTVGGNAANVAAACARLGIDTRYVGAVGDDEPADVVTEVLGRAVDHAEFDEMPGRTGVTLIRLVDTDRQFLHEDFGVGQSWSPSLSTLDRLDADWIHVAGNGTDASAWHRLVQHGHKVSVDLSTEAVPSDLRGLEVVFVSWDLQMGVSRVERGREVLAAGASMAVVTGGVEGSLAVAADSSTPCTALPITPVDTCGAGDSFIGGFLSAYLRTDGIPAALAAGTAVASATCLHLGGFPQRPRAIPPWLLDRYGEHLRQPEHPRGGR